MGGRHAEGLRQHDADPADRVRDPR
jgi:hypothetical protein